MSRNPKIKYANIKEWETIRTLNVENYYRHEIATPPREWTSEDVYKLASILRVTLSELGAVFWATGKEMMNYDKANRFPRTLSLHFEQLKAHVENRELHTPNRPIVPLHHLTRELT